MAEIAVRLLLERLSSLIVEEGKLLGGVGRDVNEIKDDLETMRSFLQDADSKDETDQGVKTWVKQVREVACDTEDVLNEFLLRLLRPRSRHGVFNFLVNKFHEVKHLKTRHRLANEVRNIKTRLKAISERRIAFSFTDIQIDAWHDPRISSLHHDPRFASLHIDEAEIVGIEVPKHKLIGWLTKGELKLMIISVVGMGGLGKTTLVKKVYDSQIVNKHFDYHIWITISKSPVVGELLRATIKRVMKATKQQTPEGMDSMDVNELIEVLNDQLLNKRYVIVFDDIWNINVWETMKYAFPNHDCGSRIIFTTRSRNVAACSNYVHDLEPLEEQEAMRLFCMKVFGTKQNNSSCPEELKYLSQNILRKCDGLPLAIVLIGGLLARKTKTTLEWKKFHDSVGAEMRNTYDLESLGRILMLSYNSLPYYLKPCFLYLSMFPEDYYIKRMTLIRMWIAEGFVEEKQGVTMEVVAGNYVNELISRSMIQVAELNHCDEVKSCRIHDLMRETIQSKSKEEYFSTTIIFGTRGMGDRSHEKARRISIYHNDCENYYFMGSRCSHIRSLMMFRFNECPRSFRNNFFHAFRLLRVLDLEGAYLVEFPPELVELIHLMYLSLRSTKISVLPKSVGKLKNLETLDLKQTRVSELPVEILKLQRLRHLLVYRYHCIGSVTTYGVSVPPGIGSLVHLQKLSCLDIQNQAAGSGLVVMEELGKLTQLRRLGIVNLRSKDGRDLCVALEKLEHLSSLSLKSTTARSTTTTTTTDDIQFQFLQLDLLTSPPQFLRHLYLKGCLMRLPVWIASLSNLVILALRYSRISCEEDDPLKAFQHMPSLVYLELTQAYNGEELCCNDVRGYQSLKKLFLLKMKGLKRVTFMEGSMLMLKELEIGDCPALEMVPQGIEHLSGLQELRLQTMHPRLMERIRKRRRSAPPREAQGKGGEDCWKVQHIPTIVHLVYNYTHGRYVNEDLEPTAGAAAIYEDLEQPTAGAADIYEDLEPPTAGAAAINLQPTAGAAASSSRVSSCIWFFIFIFISFFLFMYL